MDFLGAILLIAAVLALLLGLDRGADTAWTDPQAGALLLIAIVITGAFLGVEAYWVSAPLAPTRILRDPRLLACFSANLWNSGGFAAAFFFLPLYDQAVEGISAGLASLRLLPAIFAVVTGSVIAGFAIRHIGRFYWLTVAAHVLLPIGILPTILCTGSPWSSAVGAAAGLTVSGLGNGSALTGNIMALLARAQRADHAVTTAISYLFRTLGCAVGIAIASSAVQAVLRSRLMDLPGIEPSELEELGRSLEAIKQLKPELRTQVRSMYEVAIRWGLVACAVMLLLAVASSGKVPLPRDRRRC